MSDCSSLEPSGCAGTPGPPGPPGPSGTGYESVTTDDALSAGQIVRRVAGGNIELASGAAEGDGLGTVGMSGTAIGAGGTAQVYRSGSRCPVAGLTPLGDVYRSSTGGLTDYASLAMGDWTNYIGFNDGSGVDINIGPEEAKV